MVCNIRRVGGDGGWEVIAAKTSLSYKFSSVVQFIYTAVLSSLPILYHPLNKSMFSFLLLTLVLIIAMYI